jgi:hypothetical protein
MRRDWTPIKRVTLCFLALSYGPDGIAMAGRAADYIDRIFLA